MTKPYELLARFNKDGTVAGCHVRTIETVFGKDYESNPVPLKDATDPAFTQFVASFSAGVVAERDVLAIDKTKLTTDLDTATKERDELTKTLTETQDRATKEAFAASKQFETAIGELKANHAQIVLAKDADFDATRSELIGMTLVKQELQTKVTGLTDTIEGQVKEISRLKAAFNPPIPTPIAGETKTVSITVDATAWAGILASNYDPTLDIPAEKQATDFILNQYASKFMAWAERENFKPIEAQVEAAKKQIKEATAARAIEVLSSTKVTIE